LNNNAEALRAIQKALAKGLGELLGDRGFHACCQGCKKKRHCYVTQVLHQEEKYLVVPLWLLVAVEDCQDEEVAKRLVPGDELREDEAMVALARSFRSCHEESPCA
jgi:hypothetical protein